MKIEDIKPLVLEGLSTRQIAGKLQLSQTTVRYWLKRHGLKTGVVKRSSYKCSVCGETDRSKFYGAKRLKCGKCHNKDVIARGNANKQWALSYLGGACSSCGYSKSSWALQFHHKDPKLKDSSWNSMRGWSKERLSKELDNCVLLCANCHLEEHERLFKNTS